MLTYPSSEGTHVIFRSIGDLLTSPSYDLNNWLLDNQSINTEKIRKHVVKAIEFNKCNRDKEALKELAIAYEIAQTLGEDYDLLYHLAIICSLSICKLGNPEPLLEISKELVWKIREGRMEEPIWMSQILVSAGCAALQLGKETNNKDHYDWALWFLNHHFWLQRKQDIEDYFTYSLLCITSYCLGDKYQAFEGFNWLENMQPEFYNNVTIKLIKEFNINLNKK